MVITKCDLCRRDISKKKYVTVYWRGSLVHFSFCEKCGEPIISFLRERLKFEEVEFVAKIKSVSKNRKAGKHK